MSLPWSRQQVEWLAALGHVVHVRAPPPALPDDPLLRALLRAAGRSMDADADVESVRRLLRALPATTQLRGDPRAKRQLWPQLRALRGAGAA